MSYLRKFRSAISFLLVSALLSLSLGAPAQAAMLGTEQLIAAETSQQQRAYVQELMDRVEVRQQLMAHGVDPAEASARVDAMTDTEVQTLVTQLEDLPAGAGVLGVLAFVLIVLLITDLLGVTNVYNF
jgi:hypothetical protein